MWLFEFDDEVYIVSPFFKEIMLDIKKKLVVLCGSWIWWGGKHFFSYEWVMSHVNESYLIWLSHVPCEWVMSYVKESCPIWRSHVPYECIMSHMIESCPIWMGHVPYEWVMCHMNESCPIWMGHVPYEWVMSHMNESCAIWMGHVPYKGVMSHAEEETLPPSLLNTKSHAFRANVEDLCSIRLL